MNGECDTVVHTMSVEMGQTLFLSGELLLTHSTAEQDQIGHYHTNKPHMHSYFISTRHMQA